MKPDNQCHAGLVGDDHFANPSARAAQGTDTDADHLTDNALFFSRLKPADDVDLAPIEVTKGKIIKKIRHLAYPFFCQQGADVRTDPFEKLHRRLKRILRHKNVGATGFEPVTTPTPRECATRLRYAPNLKQIPRTKFQILNNFKNPILKFKNVLIFEFRH